MGKIILPERAIVLPKLAVAGKYRLQTHKYKSGKLHYDTGWFDNIITNVGLVDWYTLSGSGAFDTYGSMCSSCCVGTGTATPTVNDTALANFRASVGPYASGGGTGYRGFTSYGYTAEAAPDPAYWYGIASYQFGTGAASGNLTEVGVFPGNPGGGAVAPYYNGHLFSRALILDGTGNPTTITVLSDEILTVTWQLRFYLDLTDHAFTFNLNGAPINGTYRLYDASSERVSNAAGATSSNKLLFNGYTGDIVSAISGAPTGNLGGVNNNQVSCSVFNFTNDIANSGVCYKDMQFTVPINYINGTINSFTFQSHMWTYQFGQLSQPIIKSSGEQLQVNFRTSWGRYP